MKRPPSFLNLIIIFIFIATQTAYGYEGESYSFLINKARAAIKGNSHARALEYIEAAHAADPANQEPFKLLRQIAASQDYDDLFKYYFDLAIDDYNEGNFESAWFYLNAAHRVDPSVKGIKPSMEYIERIIGGYESPKGKKAVPYSPRTARREVRGDRYQPAMGAGGPYVVEHTPEFDAILAKYQQPSPSSSRKLSAKRPVAKKPTRRKTKSATHPSLSSSTTKYKANTFVRSNLAQEALRSKRAQRTPTAPISQPSQRRKRVKVDNITQTVVKPIRSVKPKVVAPKTSGRTSYDFDGRDVRKMVALFKSDGQPAIDRQEAVVSATESLTAIKHSFMPDTSEVTKVTQKAKASTTTEIVQTTPRISPISKTFIASQKKTVRKPVIKSETRYEAQRRKKSVQRIRERGTLSKTRKDIIEVENVLQMDSDLWSRQPGTVLEIEFGQSLELRGRQIKRFLAFSPEMVEADRKDKDSIVVTAARRGSTLFHVWDETGRWVFNIKGVIPVATSTAKQQLEDDLVKHVQPFRVSYSNNWNSFYSGDRLQDLNRRTINFTQWIGVFGPTPYGYFDASGNWFKFADATKNTGKTIGLSNANFGPFRDFSIRGYDASKRFSNLSLPGRSFRGILFEAFGFDRNLKYTFLRGQDRAVFSQVSEGVVEVRKSYIEGGRITLFPDKKTQYSINYARGFGEERARFLKSKIFSFEAKNQFGPIDTHFEHADDEEDTARLFLTEFRQDDLSLRVNLRDIEPGFTTITSRPSGRGEVGGNIIFDYTPGDYQFSSNVDIYRDREFSNPDNDNGLNYDLGAVFGMPLSETLRWNSSAFYTDTPQLISPRENLRLNTTLSKSFEMFNKHTLSTFFTASYQMSRFEFSPSSEYDRYGVSVGVRFPIYKNLSAFANYDYNWVDVTETGQKTNPHVFYTGINYNQNIGNKVSTRVSVTFRDEENTDQPFSFLSGTDTLRANIGVSYRPTNDVEIFLDGSVRNVWTENPSEAAFNDADLRMGVRASWDTVFRWDPSATIRGTVYKDMNKNSKRDPDEPGIEGIEILLGRKSVKSGRDGRYKGRVRAKSIKMGVNYDSVPKGFSLMSNLKKEIEIKQGEKYNIDFGFITRSGIYGVVFHDSNGNQKYDDGEQAIARARIKLDGKEIAESDFEGVYKFYDVPEGEHTVVIDVNSLPIEYLPTIRIKNKFFLKEGTTHTLHVPLKKK